MKFDLIRRPFDKPRLSGIVITGFLLAGYFPLVAAWVVTGFVAGIFALISPLMLIPWALIWGLWLLGLLSLFLMLLDILTGRAGLSVVRLIGSVIAIFSGWIIAYLTFEDYANSQVYSPMTGWMKAFIQCVLIVPVLIPIISYVLSKGRMLWALVCLLCIPILWWWGTIGFPIAIESITHSDAKRIERIAEDDRVVQRYNTFYQEMILEIRELDPIGDAFEIFSEHGELYLPWKFDFSMMSFPGISESKDSEISNAYQMRLAKMHFDVIEDLPKCLESPDEPDWRRWNDVKVAMRDYEDARRAYLSQFNLEMLRLKQNEMMHE